MGKYRLGIIGFGCMGSWHAENIKSRIDRVEVICSYDIKQSARENSESMGIKAYDSLDDFYSAGLDIVLVTTPNNFHCYYSCLSMRKGCNVVSEKPVCMNSEELEEILLVAKETNKLFTVHQNRRFDDDFAVVRDIVTKKTIGDIYYLSSRLFGSKGLPGDWRSNAEAGGGMLYDWSVHLIDQIMYLFGCPKSVFADLKRVNFKDVDDCNRVILQYDNLTVEVVVDTWCYIGEARWHISGNDGTAKIVGWPEYTGEIVKANVKKVDWEEGVILTHSGRTRTMSPRPKVDLTTLPLPELKNIDTFKWEYFYNNIADNLDKKADIFVTPKQQINLMKVIDACFESAKKNKIVNIDSEARR